MVTNALGPVTRIVEFVQIKCQRSSPNVDTFKWSNVDSILKNSSVKKFVRRPEIVDISVHCKFCTSYLMIQLYLFHLRLCGADCSDATSPATRCTVPVEISLPCGHTEMIQCFEANLSRKPPCKVKCSTVLNCGHPCQGTCHECDGVRLHKKCDKKCDKILVCGHTCKAKCGLPCYCSERCGTRCGHSQCQLVCAEPCAPCQEACLRRCPHKVCNLVCSEPCMEEPCDDPYDKILPYGHDCIGFCRDPCPTVCRTCNQESNALFVIGDEEDRDNDIHLHSLSDSGFFLSPPPVSMSRLRRHQLPRIQSKMSTMKWPCFFALNVAKDFLKIGFYNDTLRKTTLSQR